MLNIPYLWFGKLNILKMSIIPKLIYQFSVNAIDIFTGIFMATDKMILKYIQKCKVAKMTEALLKKMTNV